LRRARSLNASRPTTSACWVVSSDKVTAICSALAMTWLLVTMDQRIDNEPRTERATRMAADWLGAPFSPKKSRRTRQWRSGPGSYLDRLSGWVRGLECRNVDNTSDQFCRQLCENLRKWRLLRCVGAARRRHHKKQCYQPRTRRAPAT
jgi:hypothetical protein